LLAKMHDGATQVLPDASGKCVGARACETGRVGSPPKKSFTRLNCDRLVAACGAIDRLAPRSPDRIASTDLTGGARA